MCQICFIQKSYNPYKTTLETTLVILYFVWFIPHQLGKVMHAISIIAGDDQCHKSSTDV